MKRLLLLINILFIVSLLRGQSTDPLLYRTFDGSMNNQTYTDWGQAGTNLIRVAPSNYTDEISSPAGWLRYNPRKISNTIFAQDEPVFDPMGLSDFCWVFGQFIDHDIGLTLDGQENVSINVQAGDVYFDPLGTGNVYIPVARNIYDPQTGTSPENPREHPNVITAYIDASGVYGSDEVRANWLRSFSGGKLRTSSGNLPPFNTTTGEFGAPIDPAAPVMANATGISPKIYVVGDIRGNENALLFSFHTLFLREHNRQCEKLAIVYPDWDDEQLYNHARKIIGGLIESIVYEEWLPEMGVHLPMYLGYDTLVNPQLSNTFTAAAYRLGHTLLSEELMRLDENGEVVEQGNILLKNAFFNPFAIIEVGGVEPYFRGMATQNQQMLDAKLVNGVRNFLFGPPGAGGLDLAAVNMQRGRERGLPDFNTIRENLGLTPYTNWLDINSDPNVYTRLHSVYHIDDIDPWVGMVSEERLPDALFGETIMTFMEQQFLSLRDGDRFYYENDPVLSEEEKVWIKNTTLHDIIMMNTGVDVMQNNVFDAMPYDDICAHLEVNLAGAIRTPEGISVSDVIVTFEHEDPAFGNTESVDGIYEFSAIPGCGSQSLVLSKNDGLLDGVSTFDLVLMTKHILGIQIFDSPYQYIAADVNNSGNVSTFDLIVLRKVILGINEEFENNTSWRFVSADYTFEANVDALDYTWEGVVSFDGLLNMNYFTDYVAIKVGDVNGSYNPDDLLATPDSRNLKPNLTLQLENNKLEAGKIYGLDFYGVSENDFVGYQFGLNYDAELLEFVRVESNLPGLGANNFGVFEEEGLITSSWNAINSKLDFKSGQKIFSIHFEAKQNSNVMTALSFNERKIKGEVYDANLQIGNVNLEFIDHEGIETTFALYQNRPNPFVNATSIPFYLPETGNVTLRIFDISGKEVLVQSNNFVKGQQQWIVKRVDLPNTGVLFYQVETSLGTQVRKMILTE